METLPRRFACLLLFASLLGCGGQTDAPEPSEIEDEARAYFVSPTDGATVPTTFPVLMNVEGLTLAPAGTLEDGSGHLHILVDADFIPPGQVIPNDVRHLHYGDASTETELTLPPGPHVLRLQFADGAHIALDGDAYRDEVRITVVEAPPSE